jgi:hypothetical protein
MIWYLVKNKHARGAWQSAAHLTDDDGALLCGATLAQEDWDLTRSAPTGKRICTACAGAQERRVAHEETVTH